MAPIQMRDRAAKSVTAVLFLVQAIGYTDVCLVGHTALLDQVHLGLPPCRMLKKAAGFVLGSKTILNVPQRVRLRLFVACGLAGRPF
jgi:hypothetical protein